MLKFTIPSKEQTLETVRIGLHIWEADEAAENPGSIHGSANLIDSRNNIISTIDITDIDIPKEYIEKIKEKMLQEIGAKQTEE